MSLRGGLVSALSFLIRGLEKGTRTLISTFVIQSLVGFSDEWLYANISGALY